MSTPDLPAMVCKQCEPFLTYKLDKDLEQFLDVVMLCELKIPYNFSFTSKIQAWHCACVYFANCWIEQSLQQLSQLTILRLNTKALKSYTN